MKSIVFIAPMMGWTDRHCRYFLRLLSPGAGLYTEMITAQALSHGDRDRLLRFDKRERPIAIQLGGSDPALMAAAAAQAEMAGYDEVNINVGCPSDRVQNGQFGACLMSQPDTVAACVEAMRHAVSIPVTIKTRIGIDDQDDFEFLREFVAVTSAAGCETYVIHARKAILNGLSPKDNRKIPPLDYPRVYQLKALFPQLNVILNGGIKSISDCKNHLRNVDGVMIGREAYHNPWFLAELEYALGGSDAVCAAGRDSVVRKMLPYMENELANGTQLAQMTRHLLGLFAGQPGARAWRRSISQQAHRKGAGIDIVERALTQVRQAA